MEEKKQQPSVATPAATSQTIVEEKKVAPPPSKKKAQKYYVGCDPPTNSSDVSHGPYKTITEAIEAAEPGGIILINQGKYVESLVITKPNLRILAKEKDKEVFVTSTKGPAVYVEIPQEAKCLFANIKFSFYQKVCDDDLNAPTVEQERALELDKMEEEKNNQEGECMVFSDIDKFEITKAAPSIVYLESGTLYLQGCQLYIEGASISAQSKIACVVALPDTTLNALDCEIKGHKSYLTAGCYFRKANVTMAICKIHSHRSGGIIMESKPGAKVRLLSNTFTQNNAVGIYMTGPSSHPKIKKNEFADTTGPAIYCCIGTAPQIMDNVLRKNRVGIYVESGDPLIFKNEIKNCFETAVIFATTGGIGCGGEISMCSIHENEGNGIWVKGEKCAPRIHGNPDISLSRLAGIKVSERAHPTISSNVIKSNLTQGILLVEGSSAHIVRNEIEENIKANIAFGGSLSGDTVIELNNIVRGRAEGIFMIEGEYATIIENKIKENMDGILLSSASPLIVHNEIMDNRRCGIIMVSQCNPKILRNSIIKNYACGILVRQNSLGVIEKNEIKENYYQLSVHGLEKPRFERIKYGNDMEGAYDASMSGCSVL